MNQAAMMPSSAAQQGNRALWIPALFVLAFLIVLGANVMLVVTAVSSFSGLETDHAYEIGLHYNQTLAAAEANRQSGWQASAEVAATTGPARELVVRISDRDGATVNGAVIVGRLVRPTSAGLDIDLQFRELGDGRYSARFEPAALGNWELRMVAHRGGVSWQTERRMFFK